MTRDAVLSAWLEGARIGTLARIVNEDPAGVEDALRHELRSIREEYQPSVSAEPAPLPTARKAQAADSSPSPAPEFLPKRKKPTYRKQARPLVHAAELAASPVRKAVAKLVNGAARLSKTDLITDWLRQEPLTCSEIADRARAALVETNDHEKWASDGLWMMRVKDLVIKPDAPGGKWRLA